MHSKQPSVSSNADRSDLLSQTILSASGWRAVFGASDESLDTSISPAHRDFVACAAEVFVESVISRSPGDRPIIALGRDTRPTGPAILDTVARAMTVAGASVRSLGIAAAPEIMAYTKTSSDVDAFFYISASHNPPGHNGLKMGFADGAVMDGSDARTLIEEFRRRFMDDEEVATRARNLATIPHDRLTRIERERERHKSAALARYRSFVGRTGLGRMNPEAFQEDLRKQLAQRPLGIVAELNGSARSESIDRSYFADLGVAAAFYNDFAGEFSHQILPEGGGLEEASQLLEAHCAQDPAFRLAYVPDNDGDRGNLVFAGQDCRALALDAQTVFALVTMIELAWLHHTSAGESSSGSVVVANGPTSARIDEICDTFGAQLFRAEVGEANVVALGERLRAEGKRVVIMGEGSNGGNITPPSTVRDPLSTITALLKLHAFRLHRYSPSAPDGDETDFPAIARALPAYCTLATDDPRAKMRIGSVSHRRLKARYEAALPQAAGTLAHVLSEHYGKPLEWRVWNYEGTSAREGLGNRTGEERGGHRVVFNDRDGRTYASVWMRGSGTEPVFRVIADCRGEDHTILDLLVDRQRSLIESAMRD